MVTKELIEARWKAIIGVILTICLAILVALSYDLLRNALGSSIGQLQLPDALKSQVNAVFGDYNTYAFSQWFGKNGQMVLGGLAAFLGGGLIGGEVSKGTIFFLLSKPVSRVQVLAVKYGVAAVLQLVICVVGSLSLLVAGLVMGYPQNVGGLAISTLLVWLGTLFVVGLAALFSVIFDDMLRPVAFALLVAVVVGIPGLVGTFLPEWANWSLPNYWASLPAFLGREFPVKELAICLVAAIIPIAVAVPLFRRRAY